MSIRAQTKTERLSKVEIGPLTCENKRMTLEDGYQSKYINIFFQNEKYEGITDLKAITLNNLTDADEFKKDMLDAIISISKNKKQQLTWDKDKYQIIKFDDGQIWLRDVSYMQGFVILKPMIILGVINWIKKCDVDK